jgi:hypothetical protein
MIPTTEDIPLIVQLYNDLPIRTIAYKFDTTPRTISKILKANKVVVKKKGMHKNIAALLTSNVKYSIDEIACLVECSPWHVKMVKKSMGLTREATKKLDANDFKPVRLVQSLIALKEMSIPEACESAGITVNAYYYRKRIMQENSRKAS